MNSQKEIFTSFRECHIVQDLSWVHCIILWSEWNLKSCRFIVWIVINVYSHNIISQRLKGYVQIFNLSFSIYFCHVESQLWGWVAYPVLDHISFVAVVEISLWVSKMNSWNIPESKNVLLKRTDMNYCEPIFLFRSKSHRDLIVVNIKSAWEINAVYWFIYDVNSFNDLVCSLVVFSLHTPNVLEIKSHSSLIIENLVILSWLSFNFSISNKHSTSSCLLRVCKYHNSHFLSE